MNGRQVAVIAAFLALAGCERAPPPPEGPAPEVGPIVVYAPAGASAPLTAAFEAYTADTGVRVSARFDDSDANVSAVIERRDDPPADLLVTADVHGIWLAGMEGALRPTPRDLAAVPGDPDGAWIAIAVRKAVLVYDARAVGPGTVRSYEDLASESLKGRVCVLSSAQPLSRTVVANMIARLGARPAERAVRGWLANLAAPPFGSEDALVAAIAGGDCAIGIVGQSAGADERTGLLRYVEPPVPAVEITGAGIGRHAHSPEGAAGLLAWLADHAALPGATRAAGLDAESANTLSAGGWGAADAVKLAERAGYR